LFITVLIVVVYSCGLLKLVESLLILGSILCILIISGGKSEAVVKRLNLLGVTEIFMGVHHKLPVLQEFLIEHKISLEETLYMGDDIPDMECLKHVAASTCPADAANDIKPICLYVSQLGGGKGCVRDVIEQVLKAQHKWLDADAHTW
jgi:3-deoxy-D-manno-octulosonate 8-phosphate phosphatase (KDO 8-P phosphatase)